MQLDITTLPPITLCRTFDLLAHSSHLDLSNVACFSLTVSKQQLDNLPFGLLVTGDNYLNSSYFTEDGDYESSNQMPDTMQLDYASRLQTNIQRYYKFLVDVGFKTNLEKIVIAYDLDYANVALSLLAGYHIAKKEDPEEAVALTAVTYPNMYFDYPTICFLDLNLECNQKLIEAVETYEVMEVAVTSTGLVTERNV